MHDHQLEELFCEPNQKPTPLPRYQLFLCYLTQFAEPITASVIYPFVNQFIRDTGITKGDERKVGYYAGLIESSFFLSESLTVYHWGVTSDRVGRRPIVLLGPLGLSVATLAFGLATNFWLLFCARCIQGVFNGNIGVSKTVIAEITDETNLADAFAYIPLLWYTGITVGPIIGGILSEPATTWPTLFGKSTFLRAHPYFLPCAFSAFLSFAFFTIASAGLNETSPQVLSRVKEKSRNALHPQISSQDLSTHLLRQPSTDYGSMEHAINDCERREVSDTAALQDNTIRFEMLLVPRVLVPVIVYMLHCMIDMSCQVLLPLMYTTSIEVGGLGLDAYRVGLILTSFGVVNAIVMLFGLGWLVRKFSVRSVHIFAYLTYFVHLALYPLLGRLVRRSGRVDAAAWLLILVQLSCRLMDSMSFGSIQIIILNCAPSREALGATSGLAQAAGCLTRALAPAFASSLFAISLEKQILGGNLVYVALCGFSLFSISIAVLLPRETKL